jgi:hypothetical protein
VSTALTELDTDEVSYVDAAAVNRRFAILKKDRTMGQENLHAVLDAPLGDLEERFESVVRKQQLDPAAKEALKGILKLMTAYGNNLKDEHLAPIAQLAGFAGNNFGNASAASDAEDGDMGDEDDMEDAAEDDENDAGDTNDDIEDAIKAAPPGKQAPGKPKTPNPPMDEKTGDGLHGDKTDEKPAPMPKPGQKTPPRTPAMKKASSDIRERITKAEQRAAALETQLRTEVRKRQEREFVAKAAAEFPKLGNAEQVGKMLLSLQDKGALTDMEPMLRAMNEQSKAADIFKTAGFDGGGSGPATPEQEMEREAAEIRKREPALSYEQAFDKAYTARSDIRKRMRAAELGR